MNEPEGLHWIPCSLFTGVWTLYDGNKAMDVTIDRMGKERYLVVIGSWSSRTQGGKIELIGMNERSARAAAIQEWIERGRPEAP